MSYKMSESIKEKDGKVFIANKRMQDIVRGNDGDHAEDFEDTKFDEFAETVYNNVEDTSRWSVHYEQVFKIGERYFRTFYSEGATEMQAESPYEYDGEWIEVTEVVPKEVTITQFVPKEER